MGRARSSRAGVDAARSRRTPSGAASVLPVLIAAIALWSPHGLPAQDIDDLFNEPDAVTEGESPAVEGRATEGGSAGAEATVSDGTGEADGETKDAEGGGAVVDIDALTTSPTRVTGKVSTSAGIGLGLIEWPGTDAAEDEGEDLRDLARYDILFTAKASVSVDSRPSPYLRFRTTVSTSLDDNTLDFDTPEVDELFVDYTFANSVFVRAGKFGMSWGRARLFDNPADLVDRVDEGAAVRATVPAGPGSVTGLVYSRSEWIDQYEGDTNWRAFAGAAQWESTWGPLTTELGGHWQKDEPVGSAISLTLGIHDLTLSAEGIYNIDQDDPGGGPASGENSVQAVANFFWENSARTWSFWGEYQYDNAAGRDPETEGGEHLVGLAFKAPSIAGNGWRPGVRWRHAIEDGSGEVVPGIKGEIAPRLNLSIGVPVIYGEPGSYFREALVSGNEEDDDEETDLTPLDNVVTVLLGLSLSFSF